jgi:hypothetical protein
MAVAVMVVAAMAVVTATGAATGRVDDGQPARQGE